MIILLALEYVKLTPAFDLTYEDFTQIFVGAALLLARKVDNVEDTIDPLLVNKTHLLFLHFYSKRLKDLFLLLPMNPY